MGKSYKYEIDLIVGSFFRGAQIKKIILPECGYNNRVFILDIVPTGKIVLKFLNSSKSEEDIKKEISFARVLKEKMPYLDVPEYLHYDFSRSVVDENFVITSFVGSLNVFEVLDRVDDKEKLFEDIGEVIAKIHMSSYDAFGMLDENLNLKEGGVYDDWKGKQIKAAYEYLDVISKKGYSNKNFLNLNLEILEKASKILSFDFPACLCHGDFSLTNIFATDNQVSSVIDYEFVHSGEAVYDIFKSVRNFKFIYDYRYSLMEGYTRIRRIDYDWESLIWVYQWIGRLKWLCDVDNMSWHRLSAQKTRQRKELIVEGSIRKIEEIYDYFF